MYVCTRTSIPSNESSHRVSRVCTRKSIKSPRTDLDHLRVVPAGPCQQLPQQCQLRIGLHAQEVEDALLPAREVRVEQRGPAGCRFM